MRRRGLSRAGRPRHPPLQPRLAPRPSRRTPGCRPHHRSDQTPQTRHPHPRHPRAGIAGPAQQVSTYDLFTVWHHLAMGRLTPPTQGDRNAAHSGPVFLPWHRLMLLLPELQMQRVLGTEEFALPYWDWAADGDLPAAQQAATPHRRRHVLDPHQPAGNTGRHARREHVLHLRQTPLTTQRRRRRCVVTQERPELRSCPVRRLP
ncbi:tyrosinase family protein [Amycolatopsis pithecellobii]|uniref:Tyrosinase n=1 Tax=Amycolatopsis pithecellobii TaxID=664692 RepID=A0A6N7YXA6_9PSEU|nr:hypothetical protein [Amycolatopsis pithecellobii]